MIVNSQPYNPSQQLQQQRCVGLKPASNHNNHNNQQQQQTSDRYLVNMASNSQQNSVYGSAPFVQQTRSHMLDLANLHPSVFDSAFEDTSGSSQMEPTLNSSTQQPSQASAISGNGKNSNSRETHDISLYSPSSSTSLLYHIYDQINSPNDHYQARQIDSNQPASSMINPKKANTTILNPANLFGPSQVAPLPPVQPIQLHQHQLSQLSDIHQQQQQQQQRCFSTGQYHLQQPSSFATLQLSNNQQQQLQFDQQPAHLMQENAFRQHHLSTLARHAHRPLSSSGNSSISGQSIVYGRQIRTNNNQNTSKSHHNLASVFHNSTTLNHIQQQQQQQHHHLNNITLNQQSTTRSNQNNDSNRKSNDGANFITNCCKNIHKRTRHLAYQNHTFIKFCILIILLTLCLMSIFKFTSMSASNSLSHSQNVPNTFDIITASSSKIQLTNSNTFPYFQTDTKAAEFDIHQQQQSQPSDKISDEIVSASQKPQQQQDILKSKLLIGEFVILSQNYSQSAAQRSLLAERIVKLMDQVFLSTDTRRVYSRMEVTNISATRTGLGIVVNCNIVLTESIPYAAQEFGITLYESLVKSNERLSNQANYIIDKTSIKFNTVPDKDLKSGIVPPGLLSPSMSRELGAPVSEQPAPSSGQSLERIIEPSSTIESTSIIQSNEQQANLVVWSEWSQWSSCVDKNGVCDPTRLHSRLRKCVSQNSGFQVENSRCRARFVSQDQHLEVADCTRVCQQPLADSHPILSDAPSPLTAPPSLVEPAPFPASAAVGRPISSAVTSANVKDTLPNLLDLFTSAPLSAASISATPNTERVLQTSQQQQPSQQPQRQQQKQQEQQQTTDLPESAESGSTLGATATMITLTTQSNSQLSCANCTSDEICLLLMQQKVPFCAKVKDNSDESGCGGWCRAQNQLCQPVGANAFKCIHDSECLAEEWRCHDSACIPLSKRCDGHSNCYDSSDERDCPI